MQQADEQVIEALEGLRLIHPELFNLPHYGIPTGVKHTKPVSEGQTITGHMRWTSPKLYDKSEGFVACHRRAGYGVISFSSPLTLNHVYTTVQDTARNPLGGNMATSSIGTTFAVKREYGENLLRAIREYKIERKHSGKPLSLTSISEVKDIGGLPDLSRR